MTPDRWQHIERLYEAALRRSKAERTSFLEQACGGDEALRAEVESLLAAHDSDPSFLDTPVMRPSLLGWNGDGAEAPEASPAGRQIGPYRVLRTLGRGGMGTVYLAERTEAAFQQTVALKVLRPRGDDEDGYRRFVAERHILASLNHPNIARLYDGGVTDAGSDPEQKGRPYFVMEHVEGEPITAYCDQNRLSLQERLRLFEKVCEAVQYAHQNLVVHRDLKPGNILVTSEGTPKLLDFGIAKLLDPVPWGEVAPPETRTDLRMMTPEYAAPEQVSGEAITTATDVYALGALLYELLVGRRPYRFDDRRAAEIERIICEEAPTMPSEGIRLLSRSTSDAEQSAKTPTAEQIETARDTSIDRLQRQLRGDLDNIVLKALRKEPARRYASAEQLAADVRRHLDGLPVEARPTSLAYRVRKFVGRHRTSVTLAAIATLLLLGFTLLTAVQSAQLRTRAAEVARERDRAEQVAGFLVDLFEASDPRESQGATVTARELLERGTRRIERDLSDQPETQAEMMDVLGQVHASLGAYDQAEGLFRDAVSVKRTTLGDRHPSLAASMDNLAQSLVAQGEIDAGIALYEEALTFQRAALGDEHEDVAATLHQLASAVEERGELARADSLYREALALRRQLLGEASPSTARTLNNLGVLQHQRGRYEEAESFFRDGLAILTNAHGPTHLDVAEAQNNLAALLDERGQVAEAESLYRTSLATQRQMLDATHPGLAHVVNNLAALLRKQGRWAEAEPLFREALSIFRDTFGDAHPKVAVARNNLASLLRDRSQYAEAERLFRAAHAPLRDLLGEAHPNTAIVESNLADALRRQARWAEAEPHYRRAVDALRAAFPEGHSRLARAMVGLGWTHVGQGRVDAAAPLLREALAMQKQRFEAGDWRVAEAEAALGAALLTQGRHAEAESLLVRSHDALTAARGGDHILTREAAVALTRLRESTP